MVKTLVHRKYHYSYNQGSKHDNNRRDCSTRIWSATDTLYKPIRYKTLFIFASISFHSLLSLHGSRLEIHPEHPCFGDQCSTN